LITIEGVLEDLDGIEKGEYQGKKLVTESEKLIATVRVIMKFLSTMRSNQLLTEEEKINLAKERRLRQKAERKPEVKA